MQGVISVQLDHIFKKYQETLLIYFSLCLSLTLERDPQADKPLNTLGLKMIPRLFMIYFMSMIVYANMIKGIKVRILIISMKKTAHTHHFGSVVTTFKISKMFYLLIKMIAFAFLEEEEHHRYQNMYNLSHLGNMKAQIPLKVSVTITQ